MTASISKLNITTLFIYIWHGRIMVWMFWILPCIQKWQYIQWMLMCGVGAKSVAHLMKFHLLQWEVVKGKFLMNSNMTLTVLNLHQKTDPKVQKILTAKVTTTRSKIKSRSRHDATHLQPLTNVPTKHQLPTPYGFWDIAWTRFYRSRSLWQGQRSNQGHTMMLHTYTP